MHGEEQTYFANEQAIAGEAGSELRSDYQVNKETRSARGGPAVGRGKGGPREHNVEYFKNPNALFNFEEKRNKEMNQTEQFYFDRERPVMDRHDTKRSVNKTEEYFQPESPLFSQTGHDQKSRQHHEEEYFRARTPLKGQVSPEDMLRTQDEAQVNREQPFKDRASPKYLTDHQEYVEKAGAYFSKDGSQRSRLGTDQDFMNMEEPVKGRADHKSKSITEDFINKGDPARGKATDDDQSKSVSEKFFEKSQAQFGKDKYDRSRGDEREFENQSEDITGKSVSGESEVANHQPFNALNDLVVNNPNQSGIP